VVGSIAVNNISIFLGPIFFRIKEFVLLCYTVVMFVSMSRKHLALIHGFLETPSMWQQVLGHISKKDFVIHTPSIPGHGDNLALPSELTAKSYAQNLWQQMNIPDDEEVFIIGHSMGGYLASSIAASRASGIAGLCLFHSKCGEDTTQKKEDRKRSIKAITENKSLYVRTMINSLFHTSKATGLADVIQKHIMDAMLISEEAMVAAQTVMMDRPDHILTMQNRHFPLFYFLGDRDSSLPIEMMKEELAQLPGAVSHVAAETGHMGHYESNKETGIFLQRVILASL